jgi:hypothetical protein
VRAPWRGIGLAAVVGVTACGGEDTLAPRPTVSFVIDAPLCSSVIPVELFIDGRPVGADTFRVNLAPAHTTTRAFATSPGRHRLGARAAHGYVWPDTTVTLAAGQAFTDSLPFYCS